MGFKQTDSALASKKSAGSRLLKLKLHRAALIVLWCTFIPRAFAQTEKQANPPITEKQLIENWKAIDKLDRRQQSYKVTLSLPLKPKYPHLQTEIKVRPDRWLFAADFQGNRSIFAKSPQYVFLLGKGPGAENWTLNQFEAEGKANNLSDLERSLAQLRYSRPLGTLSITTKRGETRDPTLFEYSQRPNFKIVAITQPAPDRDRIEFSCDDASGWLLTDRHNQSVVVQSEIKVGKVSATTYPVSVEMKKRELQGSGDSLRCLNIEFLIRNANTKEVLQHELHEFSDYSDGAISDREFKLSHYGLPEPVGVKRFPNYIWFLIFAAGFALLAVGVRYSTWR